MTSSTPISSLPTTISTADLADLIGVSPRQVRNIAAEAGVSPAGRGQWPLTAAVQGALALARRPREGGELAAARARAVAAKAKQTELQIARAERELIPYEDAAYGFDCLLMAVVDELDGLGARVTRDLELRRKIEADIRAVRQRAAARLQAEAARLRAGGEIETEAAE